uniref:Putative secreted protein n=1 Tax=Anopheles darlingi TaxID=43151 RepID=A0A2M4D3Q0_ANODA
MQPPVVEVAGSMVTLQVRALVLMERVAAAVVPGAAPQAVQSRMAAITCETRSDRTLETICFSTTLC